MREFGFERLDLPLGRGSNARVIRAEEQPAEESDSLRGFFDATRRGMVPTLRYQARERLTDLMWEPVDAGRRVLAAVDAVQPDAIIVDHLAFSARLALQTAGIRYADVVLGHPSALPVAGEVYGYPPFWPTAFDPDEAELSDLRTLCEEVSARFNRGMEPHGARPAPRCAAHGRRLRRARRSRALQLSGRAGRRRRARTASARVPPRLDHASKRSTTRWSAGSRRPRRSRT